MEKAIQHAVNKDQSFFCMEDSGKEGRSFMKGTRELQKRYFYIMIAERLLTFLCLNLCIFLSLVEQYRKKEGEGEDIYFEISLQKEKAEIGLNSIVVRDDRISKKVILCY